jgi:hypothetical protein
MLDNEALWNFKEWLTDRRGTRMLFDKTPTDIKIDWKGKLPYPEGEDIKGRIPQPKDGLSADPIHR